MNRRRFLKALTIIPAAVLLPITILKKKVLTKEHPLLGGMTNQSMDTMTPITLADCKAAVEKAMAFDHVPECIYLHPEQYEALKHEMEEMELDHLNQTGFVPHGAIAMKPRGLGYTVMVNEHIKQGEAFRVKFPKPGNYKIKFYDKL